MEGTHIRMLVITDECELLTVITIRTFCHVGDLRRLSFAAAVAAGGTRWQSVGVHRKATDAPRCSESASMMTSIARATRGKRSPGMYA